MMRFQYRAARSDGERVAGTLSTVSESSAVALLSERGLIPLEVRHADETVNRTRPPQELAPVFAGIAALLEAGMPVDRVLTAAAAGARPGTRRLLSDALGRVREGSGLADALAADGGVPAHVTGMLRAGEAQGRLSAAVRRAAVELERQAELHAQLRGALSYPVFLLATGTASVALIVGFVIPKFASLLADLDQALPASTRLLLSLSDAIQSNGLLLLLMIVAAVAATRAALQVPDVRARLHRELLNLPIVGPIRWSLCSARACRTLGSLIESGVPLLSALDLVQKGSEDLEFASRIAAARADVSEGSRLESALRRHEALTPPALQLTRFGEESGRMGEFLAHAARLEDAAAQRAIRGLVSVLEPGLIVGFGAIVAFVAAALLQAVYSVRPAGF